MSQPAGPLIEPSPAEKFLGLSARPFSLTPDLRFAYHSRSHTHALEQVTAALRRREGLIVVTGAVGLGKTMLCRAMLDNLETRTFLSVILDPGLDTVDLFRQVLSDFGILGGIDAAASGPLTDVTRHQYVTTLQQFLASLVPLGAHAVIMVDEAQRLSPAVLEEIRLLSNFETDEAKLLQIVLVGQPDLDEVLHHPKMQQLNQRVARRCELQPLSESEVGDYIERRLAVAASPSALSGGDTEDLGSATVVRFSPEASKAVAGISGGIPRVINTLCDRALEAAYERQVRVVDPDAVIEAADRLHIEVPPGGGLGRSRRRQVILLVAAAVIAAAVLAWWWFGRSSGEARPAAGVSGESAPADTATSGPAGDTGTAAGDRATGADGAASVPAPTPAVERTSGAPSPDAAADAVQAPPAPAAAQAATDAAGQTTGAFRVAVAAFRTESRARNVAEEVVALEIPAIVRPDDQGNWYSVLAGPFATREDAQTAQAALARRGYYGTRILAP